MEICHLEMGPEKNLVDVERAATATVATEVGEVAEKAVVVMAVSANEIEHLETAHLVKDVILEHRAETRAGRRWACKDSRWAHLEDRQRHRPMPS